MALGFFGKLFNRSASTSSAPIFIFNTLRQEKEPFRPLRAGKVGMYHCGPTVYGYQHIGNYRAYIFSDLIKRSFQYAGYSVKQVVNITDVGHLTSDADEGDDKVEEGAKREHKTAAEITKFYTDDFYENLAKFNVNTQGTEFPKATDHILEQIAFVKTLEEKGYTYKTSDGIYFDTSLLKTYGKLGQVGQKGLREGARVAVNPEKKNPTDFALWKFSPSSSGTQKRQQEWDSPWGVGFPGWHIECSAMSTKYLGHRFDIHTGGVDHIPIHHNNEIAQSEAAFGRPFVSYWLHVAHVMIDGKKISKSLGNVILPKHVEERGIPLLAYRYWLLTSHYRSQVNFTWETLEAAKRAFFKLERFFVETGVKRGAVNKDYQERFYRAFFDDFDTPQAIAVLWNMVKDESVSKADKKETLIDFDKVLGFNFIEAQEFMEESNKTLAKSEIPADIQALLGEREKARVSKGFTRADELRAKIRTAGYEITDTTEGPQLQRIPPKNTVN